MANGNNRQIIFSIFGISVFASVAWAVVSILAPGQALNITILLGFLGMMATQIMTFKHVKDVDSKVDRVANAGLGRDEKIDTLKDKMDVVGKKVDGALENFFARLFEDRAELVKGMKAQRALGREEGQLQERRRASDSGIIAVTKPEETAGPYDLDHGSTD